MGAGKHCWHDFAYHLSEPRRVTAIGNRHLGCRQTNQDREANDFGHTVEAAEWVFHPRTLWIDAQRLEANCSDSALRNA
jgi:hypothetical protein